MRPQNKSDARRQDQERYSATAWVIVSSREIVITEAPDSKNGANKRSKPGSRQGTEALPTLNLKTSAARARVLVPRCTHRLKEVMKGSKLRQLRKQASVNTAGKRHAEGTARICAPDILERPFERLGGSKPD